MSTATQDITAALAMDNERKTMAMAIGVVTQRALELPDDDKKDLFELLTELPKAETAEDARAIMRAMEEILMQEPADVSAMPLEDGPRPARLQKYVGYISQRIRQLRKSKRWTQAQLAEKSGLPQSHISRLEKGQHSPSHMTLEKLATAFGLSVEELDVSR
ncbi:MAG: helix-turn-helix domain-containing protein [Tepidisphaeraceae bacterium]|jgi:DNA-binding XRE family transcriptional regulator